MKIVALALVVAISLITPQAWPQSTPSGSSLIPSPFSIVLTIGRWLIESPENSQVYYIRVRGHGVTESDARNEAYKRAVQEAIGSLVVSEGVVINDRLVRREILEYSSGYVDRFKVLDQQHDGRHWIVDMDVWVRHSAIADRVLNRTKDTQKFDGNRASVQIQTLNHERSQGDRILASVLADYPEKAYDIKNLSTETRANYRRGLDVVVRFDLRLNDNYVYSLWEASKTVAQGSYPGRCVPRCNGTFVLQMEGKRDRLLFADWAYTMIYTDENKSQIVSGSTIGKEPMILATLKDGAGITVERSCHYYAHNQFVYGGENWIVVQNHAPQQVRIEMRDIRGIERVKSVDLAVVRKESCVW